MIPSDQISSDQISSDQGAGAVPDTSGSGSPSLDDRLFEAAVGTLELFSVFIGRRLGLYASLRDAGPATPAELAGRAGIDDRYAREWCEQQAVAGILTVDDGTPEERRYGLPAAHQGALADPEDPAHVAPFADMVVGIGGALEEVVDAYRTGDGVPYAHYGRAFRHGQGGINRPAFVADLVDDWLPAAGVDDVLRRDGARVVDIGCGHGWSTIAVAERHPGVAVLGVDVDEASIDDARRHAAERGVAVRFEVADAAALAGHGPFDVAMLLEVVHDLSRPVEVLAAAREALTEDGLVVVADECVADEFTAPGDELERMMYGWSVSHCLPASRVARDSEALGTVLRTSQVRDLGQRAGFGSVDVVDVDAGFFRIYRLSP